MADNLDSNSFGFSIENTMEMGAGNQELLNNLFEPETSTSNPEDLQDIVKNVEDPAPAKTKSAPVKTIPGDEDVEKPGDDPQKNLSDFLLDDEEEAEDEEETASASKPNAPESTEDSGDDEGEEISKFGALAKDLFKLGVFTSDDDDEEVEINTPEEFL